MTIPVFRLLGILSFAGLFIMACVSGTSNAADTRPHCEEDQALVVAVDTDPSHGLTWICVQLDDLRD